MADARLIDANLLKDVLTAGFSLGHISTMQDIEDFIDALPTVNPETDRLKFHPASELPPLHWEVWKDSDGNEYREKLSDYMLLSVADDDCPYVVAHYCKDKHFAGWEDGGGRHPDVQGWAELPKRKAGAS